MTCLRVQISVERIAPPALPLYPDTGEEPLTSHPLEDLLMTLEIEVQQVAFYIIGEGQELRSGPTDAIVIHHVLMGDGWIELDGGGPQPFRANSLLVVPSGRAKRIGADHQPAADMAPAARCDLAGDGHRSIDVGLAQIQLACAEMKAECGGGIGLFDHLTEALVEDLSGSTAARNAFELLLDESATPRFGTRALVAAIAKQCLILSMRRHIERMGAASPLFGGLSHPRLLRAAARVLRAPGLSHSVEELATAAGMSRSAFVKKFSDAFGTSPMEFVVAARLDAAARLLANSIQPVKAVAGAVGFASRSHFSRAFRTRFGVDPTTYRSRATGRSDEPAEPVDRGAAVRAT